MTKELAHLPFEVVVKGKCNNCQTEKTLDTMVRTKGEKGVYHCIDCEVEETAKHYGKSEVNNIEKMIKENKLQKIVKWVFG